MLHGVAVIFGIGVLYLGFGFFLSRFIQSPLRNSPFLWLFLNITLLPLVIMVFGWLPVSHLHLLAYSVVCILAGLLLSIKRNGWQWHFVTIGAMSTRERVTYTAFAAVFFFTLLVPKLSLLFSDTPSIWDDLWRVRFVLSTGFDLSHPVHFHFPSTSLSYYYSDYLLPGIVFRLTTLSAQTACDLDAAYRRFLIGPAGIEPDRAVAVVDGLAKFMQPEGDRP